MKPIKLCMQAFGPFAKYHEVDFRSVNNASLFGFYGATGSGKTSILDAICFALFGKSSGGEREAETLRSDYATVEEDSFVSLIFSVGDKCYFIHRIPEYEKRKRKGVGTTSQKHEAFLFEVIGTNVDKVSLNENPGRLIAEKKITQVLENIVDILGYNAQQFRQVVMLPQGKFREFLTANSKARSEILRQLFDVSLFEKLEEALKQKSKSLTDNLKAITHQKEGVLQASGLESLALLQEEISVKMVLEEQLVVKVKSSDDDLKNLLKERETARKIAEVFVHYDKAMAAVEVLNQQQVMITEEEKNLALSKKAASLTVFAEKKNQAKMEAEKSRDLFSEMVEHCTLTAQRHKGLNDIFLSSQQKEPERECYDAEIVEAKQYMETLLAQEALSLDLKKLQAEKLLAEQKLEKSSNATKVREQQQKEIVIFQQQLISDAFQAKSLASECSVLSMQIDQFQVLEQKRAEVKDSLILLSEANKSLKVAKLKFEQTDEDFKTIELLYFSARAAHFAEGLKEGEACPVCGAQEHPDIAIVEDGNVIVSDALFKKARQDWELDEKSFFHQANFVKTCEEKQVALERDLDSLTVQLTGLLEKKQNLLGLKGRHEEKKRSLERITEEIKNKKSLIELGKDAEKLDLDFLADLELAKESFKTISESYIRKEAQCETLLDGIPVKMRKRRFLTEFLEAKIVQRDKAQASHKEALDNVQLCAQKLTSAIDQKASLELALKVRKQAHEVASELFEENLRRQGFPSEQAFEKALMKSDALVTLEKKIIQYYQDKKVAEAHVEQYGALINEQENPDLGVYEKRVSEAEVILQALQYEQATLLSRITLLKGTEQKYLAKTKEFDALDQACRRAQTLSDVAQGQGDNQRKIRLVDWLLSSYFDDVLAQANLRFFKMTNYQFRLQRGLEKSKGRGVSGLEIEVYDEWSCSSRPAVSLSGGESFLAALALALGLSDVVQQESGGVVLETIFIDEGFGHLDEESLDQALNVLTELSGHNRSVGIISHVEEVKRRVPAGFTLVSSPQGSIIEVRR